MDEQLYINHVIFLLSGRIHNIKEAVCKEGVELSPEHMKLIKQMRDDLNAVIVEDMY